METTDFVVSIFYCRDMIMVIKFYEYNIFIMMTFECHNQFDS